MTAAAFGRLCVETTAINIIKTFAKAAAFGRLCVETSHNGLMLFLLEQPPSGGCVLKHRGEYVITKEATAAAFGRLCVETRTFFRLWCKLYQQPPSGGCVLKLK